MNFLDLMTGKILWEEEGNDQGKGGDNFSVCSDMDTDPKEQDRVK